MTTTHVNLVAWVYWLHSQWWLALAPVTTTHGCCCGPICH